MTDTDFEAPAGARRDSALQALAHAEETSRLAFARGLPRPEFLHDELLAEIFAKTSARFPSHPCMIAGEVTLTYGEVDAMACGVARGLIRSGCGPGDVIGLWMPRGSELLIAQIAIAKIGAAWLPFDADAPVERIAVCLADASAKALLADEGFASKAEGCAPCAVVTCGALVDPHDSAQIDARALGASPDLPAYLIYTSGSTGTPKGIVVTGRNICHYLRSANEVYGICAQDVVFQGASVAFDLSMEEIWIPYLVGAALFVASSSTLGEVDKLPEVMEAAKVSVLDTVPTLLSLLPRDISSLRLIILGGEACSPSVAAKWWRPGRTIFNSYGPTEATVVATVAEVRPASPVSIGKPIPNYSCYVCDDALNLLDRGVEGELLIGGPGVARGYLNREALTSEKFIANPFDADGSDPVLYRSGDAVIMDAAGDLLFRGRIDDQVKIRGFRVELGEIESRLAALTGVNQSAVVLRSDDGIEQLVAFVVPEEGADPQPKLLRGGLRAALPPYMIPARFETLARLPRLASGKIDRGSLKQAPLSAQKLDGDEQEAARNETEATLLEAAKKVLPPQPIPFDADFFTDLGGHSLIAARFLGLVREHRDLSTLTLQDVYAARTLRGMAALLDERAERRTPGRDLTFAPPPLLRRFLCGAAQAIALPFILGLMTAQWLGVFVSYMLLTDTEASLLQETISLLGVYVVINLATLAIAIAAKWLIIGRTRPGRYPLWGAYYFRWWLVQRIESLTHMKWLQGSPAMRWYLSALGCKVGRDAFIGDIESGALDLVTIGAGASLGSKVRLDNARVEAGELVIGPIAIGADAYIGSSCVIEENVVIEEGAELRDLTALGAGSFVGAHEIWDGSPARKADEIDPSSLEPAAHASSSRRFSQACLYILLLLVVPPIGLLPIFPAFWVFDRIDDTLQLGGVDQFSYMMSIPVIAWPTAFVLVIVTVGFIAVTRWLILPRVREGRYSIHSWFYLRKWTVALMTEITLETLSSLFATIYMRAWYRLMGAKIGKDAEISTNLAGRYDLVEIGEKCFIADEVVLGDEDVRRGWMRLEKFRTGARVFIGNDAVAPPGADIPSGALIGIKSKPPANDLMREGDTWFGAPPMKLPVRQRFDPGNAAWTYEAPRWKKLLRAVFEAVHISLPTMLFITFGTWAVEIFGDRLIQGKYGQVFWLFTAASFVISLASTLIVVAIKWVTMGRYEPVTKPMWSFWAMRTEAVAVMYWGLAGKVLLEHLRGTPFLPWFMRLFGAKIGQGVWLDTTDITEFDCVRIGSFTAINATSALQTHLYEDRMMKVGRVSVGDFVSIGANSTVLYDAKVGDFARLGPLTVVMKGEGIPDHSEWFGLPALPRGA